VAAGFGTICSGSRICVTDAVASRDGLLSVGGAGCRFTHSVAGSAARLGDIGTSLRCGAAPAGTVMCLVGDGNVGGSGIGGVSPRAGPVNVLAATTTTTDAATITASWTTR
jgi:hypothetical protein